MVGRTAVAPMRQHQHDSQPGTLGESALRQLVDGIEGTLHTNGIMPAPLLNIVGVFGSTLACQWYSLLVTVWFSPLLVLCVGDVLRQRSWP